MILFRFLPLALVCGVAALPIYLSGIDSVQGGASLTEHSMQIIWYGEIPLKDLNRIQVSDFFIPFKSNLFVNKSYDLMFQTIYLGFVPLLLAFLSIKSKRSYARFFLPAAVVFAVLAMGPEYQWSEYSEQNSSSIYYLLARIIPFMSMMEAPWEFVLMIHFCLAVAAAFGLDWLLTRLPGKWMWLILGGTFLVAVAETVFLSPAPAFLPVAKLEAPAVFQKWAKDNESYAVFDLPPRRPDSALIPEEYFYYQTLHHKPIPYSINYGWIDYDTFWFHVCQYQQGFNQELNPGDELTEKAREFLISHNFRYVILHKKNILESKQLAYTGFFTKMLGPPAMEDSSLVIFELP